MTPRKHSRLMSLTRRENSLNEMQQRELARLRVEHGEELRAQLQAVTEDYERRWSTRQWPGTTNQRPIYEDPQSEF